MLGCLVLAYSTVLVAGSAVRREEAIVRTSGRGTRAAGRSITDEFEIEIK